MAWKLQPFTFVSIALLGSVPFASGAGFLRNAAYDAFGEELQAALGEVMGCGGQIDGDRITSIERSLRPMWRTLPKNIKGNVNWLSLRYMTYRYFMRQSSLMVRGFEPLRALNTSDAGILSKQIPAYVDKMMGGKHGQDGFSLQDSAYLVATLEQLIFDSETHLLEKVYHGMNMVPKEALDFGSLKSVLENYMVYWMMGEDMDSIDILMKNRTLLETAFPQWTNLQFFVGGRIQMMNFQQAKSPLASHSSTLFHHQYTFDDAHRVVGGITRSFQSYWESECLSMKHLLVALDKAGTGRVHLSDFYHTGMKNEWRFGESEAYLREMGLLDESAMWHGSQVIIANYLQSANNCIVSTAHYLICCNNPCEDILGDIELEVGSPLGTPTQILAVVGNMTTEDDEPVQVSQRLLHQLERVAETQGGKVALHGRLFAQWLHYVFPHDCAFPHKSGAVSMATPHEFGDFVASKKDMRKHARAGKPVQNATATESLMMSQWSSEEEFFADYSMEAPWDSRNAYRVAIGGVVLLALVALWATLSGTSKRAAISLELPLTAGKSHWV